MTTLGMFHQGDPDTSRDAAVRTNRSAKKFIIQSAIVDILGRVPATAKELHRIYDEQHGRRQWPAADLYDIRRRLTEVTQSGRVVDTGMRRNGERVMGVAR